MSEFEPAVAVGARAIPTLVKDLQARVKSLAADLRTSSDDPASEWGRELQAEYRTASERGRTGFSWSEWRDGEVDLAAVAWVLATVFIRFCEDNDLMDGPWITGEGRRHGQAADNETEFYRTEPSRNARDWLRAGFEALAGLPAGKALLDRHNLVWRAPISADAAQQLLSFWRTQQADGTLAYDFTDEALDTRFLGDLYQDLSDFAKKKYALLQTPVFVEEFILDRTLTPAIAEFGIEGLRLIDPTCGSGHFLLGAFDRLLDQWHTKAPGLDPRQRVQRALDSISGVDLNPFAVAIARFRLTVAALRAAGIDRLKDAPAFTYHLAVGDSLLYGHAGVQGNLLDEIDEREKVASQSGDADEAFAYANEDVAEHPHILDRGRYHVVVGNPPYITVKDKALNEAYRQTYKTCSGKYALSVPFMELFFELAQKGDGATPAGFVGQITSNSFMKREFGAKIIEQLLSGKDLANPVELTNVIDTSGAYIPGHGTPTVILIGRRRRPTTKTLRAVLGVRGEPGQPKDPAKGLVWSQITGHLDDPSFNGQYVTITDLDRTALQTHPWSLSGGGAGDLKEAIEAGNRRALNQVADAIGIVAVIGEEEAYEVPCWLREPTVPFVVGEGVRDFGANTTPRWWPYLQDLSVSPEAAASRWMWPRRRTVRGYLMFGQTREQRGLKWFEYGMFAVAKARVPLSLVFAFVATHNHFVLDRGGKVFNRSAPVIKLPADATEGDYLDLLGVLNSSTACFWLKQVCHSKGSQSGSGGFMQDEWEEFSEFTGTKLQEFPLPSSLPRERARLLDGLAVELASWSAGAVVSGGVVSRAALADARARWDGVRARMVFAQEELDWEVYRSYGLLDVDLTYAGSDIDAIALGSRGFEIALARLVESGAESTAWFTRHGSNPLT